MVNGSMSSLAVFVESSDDSFLMIRPTPAVVADPAISCSKTH